MNVERPSCSQRVYCPLAPPCAGAGDCRRVMSAPCALPSEQTRSIPEHIVKNMLAGVRLDALEQAADLCFNIAKRLRSYPDRSSELQAQGATECGSALMALKNAAGQVPAQTASGVPVSGPAPAAPDDDYDALHPSRYGKKGD